MKSLLILGAGQFGQVTYEIAESLGYKKIGFLDDYAVKAIGKLDDFEKYQDLYPEAIVAIDDSFIRLKYTQKLKNAGYAIPVLIHPTAYIAPSAQVDEGCIVEPKAIIHTAAKVGSCCIVSAGATINHHSVVGEACHISCNSTILQNTTVKSRTTTQSGQMYLVEPSLKNTDAWMANYNFDAGI